MNFHTHIHMSISLSIYIDIRHFQVPWCSCQSISAPFPQGMKVFWALSPQTSCACFWTSYKCNDAFGSVFCLRMSMRFFHVVPYTSSWLLLLHSIAVHEWTRVYFFLSILLAEYCYRYSVGYICPGVELLGHRKGFILASPTLSHTTKSHYFLHLHKLPTTPQISRYTHLWSDSPHGTDPRVRLGLCGQVSGVLEPLECSLEGRVGSGYKVGEFSRPTESP